MGSDVDNHEDGSVATGVIPTVIGEAEPTSRNRRAVQLVCVAGADLGRAFRVGEAPLDIGRGRVAITLRASDISRTHARVSMRDGDYQIEDLGSSNGTFLNGVQIREPTPLRVGDRIQLGSTILVFGHHDELEARMRQLQRLDMMNTFAGGLAHDFNNALTVIMSNLVYLKDRLPADDCELVEIVAEMMAEAGAAAGLAKRLLRLGRPDTSTFHVVSLDELVEQAIAMLSRMLGNTNIECDVQIPDGMRVQGASGELQQVLLNLLLNARDAMPDGGTITIGGAFKRYDRTQAHARHLPGEGKYVVLEVRDTGVGMDETTLARAFEPFFTTKPAGTGTGLGLTMLHSIVRGHGGNVSVESAVGFGTTFRIVLPCADDTSSRATATSTTPPQTERHKSPGASPRTVTPATVDK